MAGIAWGMMPVNPSRLRGRYGPALVAAAGPAMNLVLAAISLSILGLLLRADPTLIPRLAYPRDLPPVHFTLYVFGLLNLVLLLFNLVPVPPLDGSRVLANLVPAYRRLVGSPRGQTFVIVLFLGVFYASSYLFAFGAEVSQRYLALFL